MNTNSSSKLISVALALAATMTLSLPAYAIDPEVLTLVTEGDNFLAAGDSFSANISFINAKGKAADKRDWDGMLTLTDRFLTLSSEYHGKDCFLIATQIGHEIADSAAGDQDRCDEAIEALSRAALSWESGLIDIAMSDETKSQMQGMSDIADQNADYYEAHGCN